MTCNILYSTIKRIYYNISLDPHISETYLEKSYLKIRYLITIHVLFRCYSWIYYEVYLYYWYDQWIYSISTCNCYFITFFVSTYDFKNKRMMSYYHPRLICVFLTSYVHIIYMIERKTLYIINNVIYTTSPSLHLQTKVM